MIRPCCLLAILAVGGTCILAPPGGAAAPPDTTGEPGLTLASKLEDASAPKPMGWEYSCPCQAGEGSWVNKYLAAEDACACNPADWRCCSQPAVFGYADYLNWAARRPGLDFAAVVALPVPAVGAPVPLVTDVLDLGRSSDVRAGIGFRCAAGWDLALDYTHFYTANQASVSAGASGTWELLATRSLFDTTPMTSIEADGSLRLNMLDLEANWRSLLNDTLGFRAFAGFRWAEIDQQFNNTYHTAGFPPVTGTIHLPSLMDAAGIRFGAELEWRAGYGLRIFGRGAQSLLLADFHMRHFESDTLSATPLLDVPVTTSQIVPVLEAAVGIAWGRGPWEISGGYEMSNWFNMADIDRPSESLFIDGAFVRLAFSR